MRPLVLITNDDGIDSRFLHILAESLRDVFRVAIAAPRSEQSWIGRAVSRRKQLRVEEAAQFGKQCWSIDGTPTDCVNIAISYLLKEIPTAVVSGINIGYNTTTSLITCSGTVAGALEGALWGVPALAVSQEIPAPMFESIANNKSALPGKLESKLRGHARHATELLQQLLAQRAAGESACPDAVVHNLNYPFNPALPLQVCRTLPAALKGTPFYAPAGDHTFEFRFTPGECHSISQTTDRGAIADGIVSLSVLNFSSLGRDLRD